MAKKGPRKKATKPPPHCKAILLCDHTIVEAMTGKVSIIGTFDSFFVQELPGTLIAFTVYLLLTEGHEDYSIVVEIQDRQEDVVLGRSPVIQINFPDRLARLNLMIPVPPLMVQHVGTYDLVVLANDEQEINRQQFVDLF